MSGCQIKHLHSYHSVHYKTTFPVLDSQAISGENLGVSTFGQMGLKTLVIRDTKAGEPYQNIKMLN